MSERDEAGLEDRAVDAPGLDGRDVDWDAVADSIRAFLRERRADAGADGYVLGVSGGIDSALAAVLAAAAVGPENVTGMVLPGAPSNAAHMRDARELIDDLGIGYREADIQPLVEQYRRALPGDLDRLTVGNLRARTRMVLLYEQANAANELVIGPDNRSEYLLGYFTKYGDGAADVCPLGDLYKTEVYALAEHVGLDERFLEKTPTAELWEGQTDEGEIGASYAVVDAVLRRVIDRGQSVEEVAAETDVDREVVADLVEMHRASEHKRQRPPTPGLRLGAD
ncbi:MAG: NAD+ synthase [Haloferacaceae archaeon]